MNNLTKWGALSVAATLASTTAMAEGIERFNLSTSFMFEEGTYAEASYAQVTPELPATGFNFGGGNLLDDTDVGDDFNAFGLAFKTDITDRFSVGLTFNNHLAGADIDWGPAVGIAADVQITGLTLLGKYQVNERVSLLGGIKRAELKESTIAVPLGVSNTESWESSGGDDGYGYVVGAAYEIPDIALRAVLTYEGEIQIDPDLTETDPASPVTAAADGEADLSVGDVWNLSFQTGVAQNTLAFANIRYSKWEDNQGFLPTAGGPAQITDFEDGYSYTLGVAQRLSDQWAVTASLFYDPGDGEDASPLSPVGATRSLTLGARYSMPQGPEISFGVSLSKRGDATIDLDGSGTPGDTPVDAVVEGSTVTTAGIRIGYSF